MSRALIVYHTKTGHTRQAAEDLAAGLTESSDVTVELKLAAAMPAVNLAAYDLIIVGSPCWAGSLRVLFSGVAGPIARWLGGLATDALKGKAVAAFSVNCSFGGHATVEGLEGLLSDLGGQVVVPGVVVKAGAPLSLWRGPDASAEDREKLRQFGRELARDL